MTVEEAIAKLEKLEEKGFGECVIYDEDNPEYTIKDFNVIDTDEEADEEYIFIKFEEE